MTLSLKELKGKKEKIWYYLYEGEKEKKEMIF
jgi:hypothetical protein